MLVTLIRIDGYDPVAGAPVSLFTSSVDDAQACHLNGSTWWPVLTKLPTLTYDLSGANEAGKIDTPSSRLSLAVEPWPLFGRYAIADARLRIWTGDLGSAWAGYTLRFDGRVTSQPKEAEGIAEIEFSVDDRWLDTPILQTYAGTTGEEGPAALKGNAKPLSIGAPRYVPGVLVDAALSIFQISAYGSIQGVEAALERLARFGSPIADYATYAALAAAAIPAGKWATSLATGFARLGAPPAGKISFLVQGDNGSAGGWVRKPGAIIRRLALLAGGSGKIDDVSLNNLDAARPYNLSIWVDEQTSARELIAALATSVNAAYGVSWLGKLFVAPVGFSTPTITVKGDGSTLPMIKSLEQDDNGVPYWKIGVTAERTWTVHSFDEIAFTAEVIDVGIYSSTTTYREGNIVSLSDGSRWIFVGTTPLAGSAPSDANANWTRYAASAPVALGVNQIVNGEFVAGVKGHVAGWDGDAGLPVTRGLNLSGWWGILNVAYVTVLGTPATGKVFDGYKSLGTDDLSGMRRWGLVVDPGDRLYFSMLMASHRCDCRANVAFYDASGAYISEQPGNQLSGTIDGTGFGFSNGDPANARVSAAFATAPAGARYALLFPRAISTGQVNPYLFWSREFLSRVVSTQTIPPIYGPGPADRAADATGENTALDTFNVNGVPASTLITTVNNIGSDSVLSRGEKPQVYTAYDGLNSNWGALDAKAAALGIAATERAAASSAMGTLYSYLIGLSPSWTDNTTDTAISASTWQSRWGSAYGTVANLQAAIQGQPGNPGTNGVDALTISAPSSISVPCTTNGTPKAAVPGFSIKVGQAGADVTSSATYGTPVVSGLTGSIVVSGSGVVSGISGFPGDSGSIEIPISRAGASPGSAIVNYTKGKDPPAYAADEDTTITTPGTSYGEVARNTLLCGPSGTFSCAWNVSAIVTGGSSAAIDGYLEYSLNGSTWTTISGSSGSSGSFPPGEGLAPSATAGFSGSSVSLSTKQTFYVRLMMRRTGAGGVGSVGGSLQTQWSG